MLESTGRVGGRIRSEPRDPYWLNLGAHVFSGPGSATGRLVADVGVESLPVPGHLVALELNGKLLVGGRPELYPLRLPLRAAERVALMRAGARLRLAVARYARVAAPRPGEAPAPTRRRRLLAHGDDQTFSEWLGELPGDADLMFRATVERSTAEPEEITVGAGTGYFALVWSSGGGLSRNIVGGAGALVDGIASELGERIVNDAEVQEIALEGDARARPLPPGRRDRELRARHAIVATKAFDAARLVRDLPDDTRSSLKAIPYGPTVVMAMLTNEQRPMPWDDLYALATPKRSFNMLFNTVNVLRPRSSRAHARRQPHGLSRRPRRADDVRPARRGRRAGVPRRPLRDLPGGARDRERDDPAQAAAHAALRRTGPLRTAARAGAAARPHPSRRRLPRRRLRGYRHLEWTGGRAGRADGAPGGERRMPEESDPRTRYANVVNALSVPYQDYSDGSGRFGVGSRETGQAAGAQRLGYDLTLVKPGARSSPYHFHHGEEEAFSVLEGHATLRQGVEGGGEELIDVGRGDIVAFPAGTGISHQFVNSSEAPFVYLAISTIEPLDVAEYPDSDKVDVRSKGLILRRTRGSAISTARSDTG